MSHFVATSASLSIRSTTVPGEVFDELYKAFLLRRAIPNVVDPKLFQTGRVFVADVFEKMSRVIAAYQSPTPERAMTYLKVVQLVRSKPFLTQEFYEKSVLTELQVLFAVLLCAYVCGLKPTVPLVYHTLQRVVDLINLGYPVHIWVDNCVSVLYHAEGVRVMMNEQFRA
jgi:hypothetical protein